MALGTNEKPRFPYIPNHGGNTITNATGAGVFNADTNGVALYTGATGGTAIGSLVNLIQISSNDTANRDLYLYILDGATVHPLGIINVPLSSGFATNILAVNGLSQTILTGLTFDSTGKPCIFLKAGAVLKASAVVAVTAAKSIAISVGGLDTA